jgi:polysaccharide biosynthesis protein PslH
VFESCPAYQTAMTDLLYLAHCVPNPPDKGEKVRAFHEITHLASRYRLHLACFARDESEVQAAKALEDRCASVYVERLPRPFALARAAVRFAFGGCLNAGFYSSASLREHVATLSRRVALQGSFVYTAVMMQYAPRGVPILLDMVDVDSEKWFQYSQARTPGVLYGVEARRLRRFEQDCVKASAMTVLTTANEADLLSHLAPGAPITFMENGIDGSFFDGAPRPLPAELEGRPFVAFVGTMDYHPNVDGACWFAERVFPELRRRTPGLEFWIIGRNPSKTVRRLGQREGIRAIGGVPDVRPYLSAARAIVAPLRVARGIQNKVLEALAMGRAVFATEAVCRTFGSRPAGLEPCLSEEDLIERIAQACREAPRCDPAIRRAACQRFSWARNLEGLAHGVDRLSSRTVYAEAAARAENASRTL